MSCLTLLGTHLLCVPFRNYSVTIRLLPVGDGPLDAAQVVSDLVEEKFLWQLCRLYEPNVLPSSMGSSISC